MKKQTKINLLNTLKQSLDVLDDEIGVTMLSNTITDGDFKYLISISKLPINKEKQ